MKKIKRKFYFYLYLFTIFFFEKILKKLKYNFLPKLSINDVKNLKFSQNKSFFIRLKNNTKINTYKVETTEVQTNLCRLGAKYPTDKSPFNDVESRHPYTAIYDIYFKNYINKKINFAEIGIHNNNSIRAFRSYFKKAKLYAFEFDKNLINKAKKNKLRNTSYHFIDVRSSASINKSFKKIRTKFQFIIDDSTHDINDQIRIAKNCYKYLKEDGMLIIEDILPGENNELKLYTSLCKNSKLYSNIYFIECNHINKYSRNFKNDKLLFLVK